MLIQMWQIISGPAQRQRKGQVRYQCKGFIVNSMIIQELYVLKGMLRLCVKDGSQLYEAPPRRVAYALQEELD